MASDPDVSELLSRIESFMEGDERGSDWGLWDNTLPPPFMPSRLMRLRYQFDKVRQTYGTTKDTSRRAAQEGADDGA